MGLLAPNAISLHCQWMQNQLNGIVVFFHTSLEKWLALDVIVRSSTAGFDSVPASIEDVRISGVGEVSEAITSPHTHTQVVSVIEVNYLIL